MVLLIEDIEMRIVNVNKSRASYIRSKNAEEDNRTYTRQESENEEIRISGTKNNKLKCVSIARKN